MTISLKHKFQSAKSDGSDSSLVKPSNWNDEHDLTLASGRVLGRTSSGAGAAEELDAATVRTFLGGRLPPGHIHGLLISNNSTDSTNDIDISAGTCRSDDDTEDMVLTASRTKRLDASWAVGSGNGGRDTGSISNNWWYVWLIKRTDTGVVDALFSLSATSPTMPTNYTKKRRIGAINRSSGAIRAFTQVPSDPDRFLLANFALDVNASDLGTSSVSYTLTCPPNMVALFRAESEDFSGLYTVLRSLVESDAAPTEGFSSLAGSDFDSGHFELATNASSQIAARASHEGTFLAIGTYGWRDTRGRLA